ncbi:UNVERIFIED_CONTAM: hypothetical protein K2H54_060985 [Gekko kuhli]
MEFCFRDLPALWGGVPQANGPPLLTGALGTLPSSNGLQQRINEWVAKVHEVALQPPNDAFEEEEPWPTQPLLPSLARST